MSNLYPPILDSQRESIRSEALTGNFLIPFTMPLSVNPTTIGHVQVLIRRQANMDPWSDQSRILAVPEKDVIYLPASQLQDMGGGLWRVNVPQAYIRNVPSLPGRGFSAGVSSEGEIFTTQLRFGNSTLSYATVQDFAVWKQNQIVNSLFGEWSNTQRMFCYQAPSGGLPALFSVNVINDPIAKLNWSYTPVSIDPLAQVRISYSWSTPDSYGNTFKAKNLEFKSNDGRGASSAGDVDLGVMRFAQVTVVLDFLTINNTSYQWVYTIPVFGFAEGTGVTGSIIPFPIIGEELEDGVIGMTYAWRWVNGVNDNHYYNIYRIDAITLETVLLATVTRPTPLVANFDITIKDYSVEMGAEYIYFGVCYNNNTRAATSILVWPADPNNYLKPTTWNPPLQDGYARHMNFQNNIFLTTKWQQLRLQGNVVVSGLKRNTSDQFTQTIGGEYPFYSRSAKFNYKTLSLSALISMNFDNTNTFLRFKSQITTSTMGNLIRQATRRYQGQIAGFNKSDPDYNMKIAAQQVQYYNEISMIYKGINPLNGNPYLSGDVLPDWMTGQLWLRENQDLDHLILRQTELFTEQQISLNIKRTQDKVEQKNQKLEKLSSKESDVRGPTTIYNQRLMRDATHVLNSDRKNDIIYAERKFRDAVMSWQSDGNPKLLRSETEGNMIVILSGVSFSPFDKTRKLYSLSATVTEIAEYNLSNLIQYGLVPVDFESFYIPNIEFGFILGNVDPNI